MPVEAPLLLPFFIMEAKPLEEDVGMSGPSISTPAASMGGSVVGSSELGGGRWAARSGGWTMMEGSRLDEDEVAEGWSGGNWRGGRRTPRSPTSLSAANSPKSPGAGVW